jgi:branched-chain amino acid aminotransferase
MGTELPIHHLEAFMDLPKYAYFMGKIVPFDEAKVSVATHAFNYGTAVFGGLRGYWNDEQKKMYVFRPLDHFRRLLNSAKMMCMEVPHTPESLTEITLELIKANGWAQDIYIRPVIYKSDLGIGVRLHNLTDALTIFTLPSQPYLKNDTSVHATVSSWRRVDDNIIPARGKVSGAYANSALTKTEAVRAGFDEVIVLNQDGHVSEGSAMNIFIIRDGVVITPPVTDNILEGITRRSIIELAQKELGLTVVERSVDRTELYIADEIFMTGTAAQVIAITRVDFRSVGSGVMGSVTAQLRSLYEDILRGRNPNYTKWTVTVPQ